MNRTRILTAAAGLVTLAYAAPAPAQYYPPPPPRTEAGRVAQDVARQLGEAAAAVGEITNAFRGSLYGVGYRSEQERWAIDACGARAARYGRVSVSEVRAYGPRSWYVRGFADRERYGGYGYGHGYERRAFDCTVRDDGRVKFHKQRVG